MNLFFNDSITFPTESQKESAYNMLYFLKDNYQDPKNTITPYDLYIIPNIYENITDSETPEYYSDDMLIDLMVDDYRFPFKESEIAWKRVRPIFEEKYKNAKIDKDGFIKSRKVKKESELNHFFKFVDRLSGKY